MAGDAFPLIPIHNHHFDFRIGESRMKNFRNFVSAALALTLTLSLAACGSQ